MATSPLHEPVLGWYAEHARDLPWRGPDRSPWGVLVSEVMLQQTPVDRVVPAWEAWMTRWPRLGDLAQEPAGEAVRQWGRLGYPRRALRLHAAAQACRDRFDEQVPATYEDLLSLPGVGDYTAAAVLAFAYGQRSVVLDTNVRRVLARLVTGQERAGPSISSAERAMATALVPEHDAVAATWAVAVMELGALVCTASAPRCHTCPVSHLCTWRLAGSPPHDAPARPSQRFVGTDRQVRGLLLSVLRESRDPVGQPALDAVWHDPVQRARALDGLVADGLVEPLAGSYYRLPL